ncbi:MAG: IS66 family transposase zinc-finger binding domain-containing protein [Acidobacteriales bacterium]|nr:IS66 family transposase zinc-finger binding domain-containing protein [Terriglobales bacterium]
MLLEQALAAKEDQLQLYKLKVDKLEEFIRLLRTQKYGAKSEKLSDAQLAMLELEPGLSNLEVEAESERAAIDSAEAAKKKRGKHPGRQTLPPHLPRVERIIACSPEQQNCKVCHQETVVIGYESSEQLDVEPAKYFVLVLKREKRACQACERHGVVCAQLPPRVVEKGLASDQVVIDTW